MRAGGADYLEETSSVCVERERERASEGERERKRGGKRGRLCP